MAVPRGMALTESLERPMFHTPRTKAEADSDINNRTLDEAADLVGRECNARALVSRLYCTRAQVSPNEC